MHSSKGPRADPALIVVGGAMAVFVVVALVWWLSDTPLGVDSAVYRAGGFAVLHGESLYSPLRALPEWAPELPFTYPPFAALLFTSLTALPAQLSWGLLALAAAPSLYVALRPFAQRAHLPLLLLGAFALQPVWQTVGLGQVNLVLMAAVVADMVLLPDSRYRGIAIGLAAAVKLIPLIFLVHSWWSGGPRTPSVGSPPFSARRRSRWSSSLRTPSATGLRRSSTIISPR